jgi:hypothetical protein
LGAIFPRKDRVDGRTSSGCKKPNKTGHFFAPRTGYPLAYLGSEADQPADPPGYPRLEARAPQARQVDPGQHHRRLSLPWRAGDQAWSSRARARTARPQPAHRAVCAFGAR